ncbi:MAG: glycosyltransferase family 1 protein [Armatimonadetes bacterium CG_4_10_14_0_8_um_filter_66_14]|nr:glycosyltransferase family 4 protein [Armatimonadota bacterium]PIZ29688.1 MAG: glycosyltransferase family 1 protein [Armatimonadetes bacterium CG_4_10_14_0_8_um_filter_66_14]
MKVCHVITRMIVGGAQLNTLQTVLGQMAAGHEVALVCGPQTGPEGQLRDRARAEGVDLRVVSSLWRELSPAKDARIVVDLVQLLRQLRPDLVHTHSSKAGIVGRWAAKIARVPHVVHTVHGFSFHDYAGGRDLYLTLERLTARCADRLIFISEPLRRLAQERGVGRPEQYAVVPSGIDLGPFRQPDVFDLSEPVGFPPDGLIVGTVARLVDGKGHSQILEMAPTILEQVPEAQFVFVGAGPLQAELERQSQRIGLEGRVRFLGLRQDVPHLLRHFDVFLLPTLWEGMGRVFLEAQAAGVPVVANRVEGVTDVVQHGETGFLVNPGETDAMAAHVVRLLMDSELRRTMGEAGRAFVDERFSDRTMVARIGQVYDEVLGAKQAGQDRQRSKEGMQTHG